MGDVTVFPEPIGMAASFNDALVYRVFDATSDEMRAKWNELQKSGGDVTRFHALSVWTPNVNIFRDPRWGRGQETYGEDPYLTSQMGCAVVRGLQGPEDTKYRKLWACAKHYAIHSGPEWARHTDNVTDVRIDNKEGNYVVQNPVKSVLAELTIIIENVPKGTEMSGKALDAAWCLFPTQKNSDGEYGLPSIKPTEVEMPTILATESTLQSEVIRLMPTIQGSPASHVYLRLLLPNGTLQEYDITAPAMKVGGKYELRLNYNQMQPKMNLEATINGWTNLNNEVEIK